MDQTGWVFQGLRSAAARFLDWWKSELRWLVPARVRSFLAASKPVIVLAVLESGYSVFVEKGSRIRPLGPVTGGPLPLAQALDVIAQSLRSYRSRPIGIRLPLKSCYVRSVGLPANARRDFESILNLDLVRATPFKLQDVYTTYFVESDAPRAGKLQVQQIVAKRDLIDPLLSRIESLGPTPVFADCWAEQLSPGLPVNFLPRAAKTNGFPKLFNALAGIVLLLAATAVYLTVSTHQAALEDLRTKTAATRANAVAVARLIEQSQTVLDDLGRLQALKLARPTAIALVEEVTRLLPDTVWLTDLRIEGEVLELSGLAKSGAALPPLFERSALLSEATLTAPITFDPREDKERFSLRLKVVPAASSTVAQKGAQR
jgi:general secretion pathway protein L